MREKNVAPKAMDAASSAIHVDGERYKLKAGSHLLFMRGSNLLMLKRSNTGYGDGMYALVAGHLDAGETMSDAAVREAKEEVGVEVKKEDLRLAHVMHRTENGDARIIFYWEVKKWKGEPRNNEPNKCSEVRWFDINHLPDNALPFVKFAVEQVRKGVQYSEYGWEK